MADRHNVNARITSVNYTAADTFNYKAHAEGGIHFLTDTNAAPVSVYYGFIVTGSSTTISSITYLDNNKNSGDITAITLAQGLYYPIPGGFSTVTLSAGDIILLKSPI